MAMRRLVLTVAILGSIFVTSVPARADDDDVFAPLDHFPERSVIYLSVNSIRRVTRGLAATVPGRIVNHPGVRQAFAGGLAQLRQLLAAQSQGFVALTGKTPLELGAMLEGQVALTVRGLSPAGLPELALAVELGESRDELLRVVARIGSAWEAAGQPLRKQSFDGYEATVWPTPIGNVFSAALGTHFLFVTSEDLMRTIVGNLKGNGGRGLKESSLYTGLRRGLGLQDEDIFVGIDTNWLRTLLLGFAGRQGQEAQTVVSLIGLDSIGAVGKAFRLRDGRLEASIHLALPNGPSGVLAALQGNFGQVAEVDEALRRMPRAATGVQATRLKPGNVLRQVDALIREHLPEVGGALDGAYGQLAAATGVSVREDLFGLGEVSCFSFSVPPPAGGLFADRLMLVKTREVAPYWQLLGKVAAHIGTRVQSQEWSGNKLEYVPIVIDGLSPGADPGELLLGGMPGPTELVILAQAWILSGGVSLNTVARADLPGGWTVLSNVPQSVARYLTHYREGPPLSGDTELLALAREQLTGAASASVSRGDHSLLWIYNTLLTVGNSFSPFLSQVGIDIARLPPGEAFLGSPGPGHSRLMLARNGFTLRGRSSFESSSSLLIALAATGMVAGVVMPMLSSGREEAYKVQCASNLKNLYTYSMLYADKTTRAFPHDPKGSVASLQKLVDYFPEDLRPQFFICSKGHAIEAATRPDGAFRLTGETCSYEIVPWRVKVTARRAIVLYDKDPHHGGGRNVAFSDGSVMFVSEAEFQERYEENRRRLGQQNDR